MGGPQPIPLGALRVVDGAGSERLASHLDRDFRVGAKIQVPSGMRRRAALRPHDHIPVAVATVDEGRYPRLAGLGPDGVQEQHRPPPEGTEADLAAVRAEVSNQSLGEIGVVGAWVGGSHWTMVAAAACYWAVKHLE